MQKYHLFLLFSFCASYFVAYFLYPYLFRGRIRPLSARALASVAGVAFLGLFIYFVSTVMPGSELGNRVLHGLGGVLATVICYMAVRDSGLGLSRFRFFVFTFLFVMTLGVGNEIMEYFLHNFTGLRFSTAINDTWLDLISNAVGALLAGILLSPLLRRK